jgi:hypothetical protein
MAPALLLILLVGPIGFLVYLAVRAPWCMARAGQCGGKAEKLPGFEPLEKDVVRY